MAGAVKADWFKAGKFGQGGGNFDYVLRQEKVRVVSVANRDKVAKTIAERCLLPILNNLDGIYKKALDKAGKDTVEVLKAELFSSAPSGARYRIIRVDEGAPPAKRGEPSQRYQETDEYGEYRASLPGELPAKLTGSLIDSIAYSLNGPKLVIGQLIDVTGFELKSLFFKGRNKKDIEEGYAGRIFISDTAEPTPVREYGNILEGDVENGGLRPWFGWVMDQFRGEMKANIKEELWKEIKRHTRSTTIQKALFFRIYMEKM